MASTNATFINIWHYLQNYNNEERISQPSGLESRLLIGECVLSGHDGLMICHKITR